MNEKQILFNVLLFGMFNIIWHLAVLAILSNRTKDFPYQAVGKCRCQCSVELEQLLVYLKKRLSWPQLVFRCGSIAICASVAKL